MAKVICEPAIYFHGDKELLKEYVVKAAACGSDFFKLQIFNPTHLLGEKWKRKKKFFENNYIDDNILGLISNMVYRYGMELVCTANYIGAVKRIIAVTDNIKIASGQILGSLVDEITKHKWKRIFVSTGMIADEVHGREWNLIRGLAESTDELIIMHCRSLYPTEYSEIGLNRMRALFQIFSDISNSKVGYSDHCYDNLACIMAMGMWASYIEKHFKISGAFGPTIECAADEEEFAELCACAKQQDKILGEDSLCMHPREMQSMEHYRDRFLI